MSCHRNATNYSHMLYIDSYSKRTNRQMVKGLLWKWAGAAAFLLAEDAGSLAGEWGCKLLSGLTLGDELAAKFPGQY